MNIIHQSIYFFLVLGLKFSMFYLLIKCNEEIIVLLIILKNSLPTEKNNYKNW